MSNHRLSSAVLMHACTEDEYTSVWYQRSGNRATWYLGRRRLANRDLRRLSPDLTRGGQRGKRSLRRRLKLPNDRISRRRSLHCASQRPGGQRSGQLTRRLDACNGTSSHLSSSHCPLPHSPPCFDPCSDAACTPRRATPPLLPPPRSLPPLTPRPRLPNRRPDPRTPAPSSTPRPRSLSPSPPRVSHSRSRTAAACWTA